jgi:hypothetical protein
MADNKAKMEDARKRAEEAANAGNDMISKLSTTYKAGADKDFKRAIADFKKVPQDVRDAEAYKYAGYKKGGSVSSASSRADGCAQRGKTKGRMI